MKKVILTEAKLRKLMVEMKFNQDIVFVSFLPERYDKKKFKGVEYDWQVQMYNKCRNGLWASPIDSEWGWEKWVKSENFGSALEKMKYSFFFKLKPGVKIYSIDDIEDLKKISTDYQRDERGRIHSLQKKIDFRKLLSKGYDGIYASENAVRTLRNSTPEMDELYGWDVESICIFNPDAIIPIGEDEVMDKMSKYPDVRNHNKFGLNSDEFDWNTLGSQIDNPNRVTHYGDDRDSWDLIDSYYNATSKNPPGEGREKALKVNDMNKAWKEHEAQEKNRKAADKRSMTNTLKAADKRPLIKKSSD